MKTPRTSFSAAAAAAAAAAPRSSCCCCIPAAPKKASSSAAAAHLALAALADAVTEIQADKFLENPIAALTDIDFDKIFSPSEWGADMTDDQREKVQEVIIPVIIVSNIVSSVMSLRRL